MNKTIIGLMVLYGLIASSAGKLLAYEIPPKDHPYGVTFTVTPKDRSDHHWFDEGAYLTGAFAAGRFLPYTRPLFRGVFSSFKRYRHIAGGHEGCFIKGPGEDFVGKGKIIGQVEVQVEFMAHSGVDVVSVPNERDKPKRNEALFTLSIHSSNDGILGEKEFKFFDLKRPGFGVNSVGEGSGWGRFKGDLNVIANGVDQANDIEFKICQIRDGVQIDVFNTALDFIYE